MTKFTPPRLSVVNTTREKLCERISEGLHRRLTLISAPAGFGKSTLVAQWLASTALSTGWLSLDQGDNDPTRFWQYVITCCQKFHPDVGSTALSMLRAPQQPLESALTSFTNDLMLLSGQYVLVMDDYHVVESPMIHESMSRWIEHIPSSVHLIMITRHDPLLPLARLRAHDEINELRVIDLQFSAHDIELFLARRLSFFLSSENIKQLEERTQGWVVGLQIASLLLQKCQQHEQIDHFFVTFTGGHRHILEYLVSEVFAAQNETIQEFLLQTAFLPRLHRSLCDAVTGRDDSAALLKSLEASNLFLIPLDDTQQWYRYHDLFAEAMQHYASASLLTSRLRELHHRASAWYETHGSLADAVEAAFSAQMPNRAAELIARMVEENLISQEMYTLRHWISQLPDDVLCFYPNLCLNYGRAILFTSDRHARATLELMKKPLQMAEEAWRTEGNKHKQGEVMALRSVAEYWQGKTMQWPVTARQALTLLDHRTEWRGIMLLHIATSEYLAGHSEEARRIVEDERLLIEVAGNEYATRSTINLLAHVSVCQGRPYEAQHLLQDIVNTSGKDLRHRAHALLNLGTIAFENNDLDAAYTYGLEAYEIAQKRSDQTIFADSSILLARIKQAQGETAEAQQMLEVSLTRPNTPLYMRKLRAWLAWLNLMAGDIPKVQSWHSTCSQRSGEITTLQQEHEELVAIRLLTAQGKTHAAHTLLDDWQAKAQADQRGRHQLEIWILKALAYFVDKDLHHAQAALRSALSLACNVGYMRLFLQEGNALIPLLKQIDTDQENDTDLSAYIHNLLRAFRHDQTRNEAAVRLMLMPYKERLSSQEQRVLRLLGEGLSTSEIAQELNVSVNTIKTQLKSIYSKLQLSNRTEARKMAQQITLL